MTNYYHVLGLSQNASAEEIKAAFKKQAVKYHPDKHPDKPQMEEKFKEINQAYQILSDEYEKTRYDLKLEYRKFTGTPKANPYSYPGKPRYRRPVYTPPRVDYRQNTIATLYAFGITFGIALIVMISFWIKGAYDQMQLEKLLVERREVYQQAKDSYGNEDYEGAFTLMSSLNFFRMEESDMKLFKDNMVSDVVAKGNYSFDLGDYDEAIGLYEMVQRFEPEKPFFALKVQLAEAYKKVNDPAKSIKIYEDLMVREYRIIASMVEIAEIRRDFLQDIEAARDYYLDAHQRAVKQYKSFYGEGYPLVINQRYVPESHYDLYTGLADIYLRLNNPEMAIKAADWNKYVWPDSIHAYLISANAYATMEMNDEACQEFIGARNKGWEGIPKITCN
ncbi:MAG: DnaJ domain-containing protein [Cyclobacteriaceae bacterium]